MLSHGYLLQACGGAQSVHMLYGSVNCTPFQGARQANVAAKAAA